MEEKDSQTQQPDWLTVREVAQFLRFHPRSIRIWIRDFPPTMVVKTPGGHYRIHRDLLEWMKASTEKSL